MSDSSRPTDGHPTDGHVGDLVSAHLDGELDAETTSSVREHLDECAACRQLADDSARARAWLQALPEVDGTPVVEHLLSRHRAVIRAGAAFVGLAAVVVGSLAITAAVIRPDVVPAVDALVAAHLAAEADRSGDGAPTEASSMTGMASAEAVPGVGRPYSAPVALHGNPASLTRLAMYDGDDLTIVRYDNGEVRVSVFQQPGQLDWDGLPPGTVVSQGDRQVWMPAGATGDRPTVLVSQIGHLVVTVVSEDSDAASAAVAALPGNRRDRTWDRIHDACSRLTAVFSLRG